MNPRLPFLPALAAVLPFLTVAAVAQQPAASGPGMGSALDTISLPVTVVDSHGDPVKGLTAADLTLTDGGQKQTIQSFGPDPNLQLTFGIVAEAGSGMNRELGDLRLASLHFIDHTLPGVSDKGFVAQYDNEVDLLADPTSTANKLHDAVDQIGSPQSGGSGQGGQNGGHGFSRSGGTLYDAIWLASKQVIENQPGRRVLILISDGIDHGSKETMADAIEAAQNAHVNIFAIYFRGEEAQNTQPGMGRHRGGMGYPGGGGGYPGGGYPGGGGGYPGGGYPGGGYPGGGGGYPGTGGGGGRHGGEQPSEHHHDGRHILEQICSATGGYMVEGKDDKADKAYGKLSALLQHPWLITWKPDANTSGLAVHHLKLTTSRKDVWALIQTGLASGPQ